jgi:hypothetical protein
MVAKGLKRKLANRCDQLAQAIADGAKTSKVPADVIDMLEKVLPLTLAQPKDKRHRFQDQAIEAVNHIIQGIEGSLKSDIGVARSKKLEADTRAAPCEKDVTETEKKLEQDVERFGIETKALAKAATDFRAARTAVQDTQSSQETGDKDFKSAAQKKEKLQGLLDEYVEPLKSGSVPEGEVDKRCKALQLELKHLEGFDEAMLIVLGSTLAKAPAARGGFDSMAIDQLDKYMSKHMEPLVEILQAGEEGKWQRASAVVEAQRALEDALDFQKLRAREFESAWKAQKDDEQALETARQALKDLAKQTTACDKVLYQAEADFEVFEEFARRPFEELKELREPVEPEQIDSQGIVKDVEPLGTSVVLPEAITA